MGRVRLNEFVGFARVGVSIAEIVRIIGNFQLKSVSLG